MSRFSELRAEQQVGIAALTLMGLGLTTKEGQAAFTERGAIGGAGAALVAGTKAVAGVPLSFIKGIASGAGLTNGDALKVSEADKIKFGGLLGETLAEKEEKAVKPPLPISMKWLFVGFGVLLVLLGLLWLLKKK